MIKIAVIYHSETGNTGEMAELVSRGCHRVEGVEARSFETASVDEAWLSDCRAMIFGSPTYYGSCSWQMKQFLDVRRECLAGKLGGVFVSQHWPGGGGASFAEMTIIAALLIHGMLVYSGGTGTGSPFVHFGAVSMRKPEGIYAERCLKLGENIARKAVEIFGGE